MEKKKLRITIRDLPADMKVSEKEMQRISGGFLDRQLTIRNPISEGFLNQQLQLKSPRIPELLWGPVAMECASRCRGFGI
jgi:hypothetical protein